MTPPQATIYWRLEGRWSDGDKHINRVGATIIEQRKYVWRIIKRSNGVPLPLYGTRYVLLLPQPVENTLVDYITALKVRRQAKKDE